MRNFFPFLLVVLMCNISTVEAQRKSKKNDLSNSSQPSKLVVGIVVDQMRYDYLTRFWNHYGEGGFKRLINQGFNCKNHHFNYAPTSTGPGHASVYTGASPSAHGVIGNNWFSRAFKAFVF